MVSIEKLNRKIFSDFLFKNISKQSINASDENVTPNLGISLNRWDMLLDTNTLIDTIGISPLCLIEGCAIATNGKELREFLSKKGIVDPSIHAIDLSDVPKFYLSHGIEMPDVEFFQANAIDLSSLYDDSSVNLILQDGILNCSPPITHPAIMKEAHRILKPSGLVFSGFTELHLDSHKSLTYSEIASKYKVPVNSNAANLASLLNSMEEISTEQFEELRSDLSGMTIKDKENRYAYVTKIGIFEFSVQLTQFQKLCKNIGFRIESVDISRGLDDNNIVCDRYRMIVKKI